MTKNKPQDLSYRKDTELCDAYPAAYLQQGMLIETEKDLGKTTYHDVFSYIVNAEFNCEKFLRIWNELIIKHEVLRLAFEFDEEYGYICKIYNKINFAEKYTVKQFSYKQKLREQIKHEACKPFLITDPGLFRIIINIKPSSKFILIFSFHHAILDGWSVISLISEFVDSYVNNIAVENNIELSYAQFIAKEIEALKNKHLLSFWRSYLSELDIIKPKWNFNDNISKNLTICSKNINKKTSTMILDKSYKYGVSVDSLFLSAYVLLLRTFLSTNDITLGLVVNNRLENDDGDRLLGLFLNTIPIRIKVKESEADLLNSLTREVNKQKILLQKYKIYPYGKLKSELGFTEDIYYCAFNYVHFHVAEDKGRKSNFQYETGFEKSNIPFVLNVYRNNNQFNVTVKALSYFVDHDYISYLLKYYLYYLDGIVKGNEVRKIPEPEYKKIIYDWNRTEALYPPNKTISQVFEEQVEKAPNNIAVVFENKKLTYKELNEKVNQLAHLIKHNYKENCGKELCGDALIGIYLKRSLEMIIGILGILKAGAAYVPFDVLDSKERLQFKIKDSNCKIVLTIASCMGELISLVNTGTIFLSMDLYQEELEKESKNNPKHINKPTDLAYVIYTSGTTGSPKGVMVEHRGVINLVDKQALKFGLNSNKIQNCLQFAAINFDASISEIFCTLLYGHRLYIASEDQRKDIDKFDNLLNKFEIGVATLPPSLLRVFPVKSNSIKTLIVAGDVLLKSILDRYYDRGVKVINAYGPTEATVCTSLNIYKKNGASNIGKALENTKLYILSILKPNENT